ncbi:hypothetical protein ACE1CD_25335 [Aerosakkonema sp. BLCC-F183]
MRSHSGGRWKCDMPTAGYAKAFWERWKCDRIFGEDGKCDRSLAY